MTTTAFFTSLLNHTVTVLRPTLVPAGPGASTQELATVASVSGAYRPTSQTERLAAERLDLIDDHRAYLPAGTDVQRGDRVRVSDDAALYRVVSVNDPGGRGHHLELGLRVELDA